MRKARPIALTSLLAVLFLVAPFLAVRAQQNFDSRQQQADLQMLHDAKDALQKDYYDPKMHGLDLNALYNQYQQKIQASTSNRQAFGYIAAFIDSLHDTHTHFIPPGRIGQLDYGYTLQMIGEKCFVTHLRPQSDAEAKLHVGDQVMGRDGGVINRADFPEMLYYYNTLSPAPVSNFDLVAPDGSYRRASVNSKTWTTAKVLDLTGAAGFARYMQLQNQQLQVYDRLQTRYIESGDVLIWNFPEFLNDRNAIDNIFSVARRHKALIIDLRGNPGGLEDTLTAILGFLFDHDVKVADRVARKNEKPVMAKSQGGYAFSGKVFVLVDSQSASSSELLARTVQLENRGKVIGDQSAGAVMESRFFPYQQGVDQIIAYDFQMTVGDLIMKDGKSLEHVGVTPDEILLPTAQDLAAGRDPVLARAIEEAGGQATPEEAGKMFPYDWVPI